MRTSILAFILVLAFPLSASASCYRGQWFVPWLTYVNCTHPALGDPAERNLPESRSAPPPRDYEPECPKGEYDHDKPESQGD